MCYAVSELVKKCQEKQTSRQNRPKVLIKVKKGLEKVKKRLVWDKL